MIEVIHPGDLMAQGLIIVDNFIEATPTFLHT